MSKNKKFTKSVENQVQVFPKEKQVDQSNHIGNIKLAVSKKAIKIHIFENNLFYVVPLFEIVDIIGSGRVFTYIENKPECVGEIRPPLKGKDLWTIEIKTKLYYIPNSQMQLLIKETPFMFNLEKH